MAVKEKPAMKRTWAGIGLRAYGSEFRASLMIILLLSIGGMFGALELHLEYDYEGALLLRMEGCKAQTRSGWDIPNHQSAETHPSPELLRSYEAHRGFSLSPAPFDDGGLRVGGSWLDCLRLWNHCQSSSSACDCGH